MRAVQQRQRRRVQVLAVRDQRVERRGRCGRGRGGWEADQPGQSWLARLEPAHGVQRVREGGCAGAEGAQALCVGCAGVAERDSRPGGGELLDQGARVGEFGCDGGEFDRREVGGAVD